MNDAREALIGLLVGAIMVAIFLLFGPGTAGFRMLCPQPVYQQGTTNLLSCHRKDKVILVTPTPAEVRR
jgi:hypothetical protein